MAVAKDLKQDLRRLAERIRGRRTIKLFLQTPVSRQVILDAIEVARWAPNHHVTEPWHFYLLGENAMKANAKLIRQITAEASDVKKADFKAKAATEIPGWLVVTCKRSEDEVLQREDYASCCCAMQNLMLYFSEAGVGSKWATGAIVEDKRFFDMLGADQEQEFVVGVLRYGYPKTIPIQSRKDVSDIVTELE
ncbi:MAG: nitroreductase [Woeseiaceae bacterium]